MAMVERHVSVISAALCSTAIALLSVWYSNPDLVSKYIASSLAAFAGFKAWLTPPILFLLMNGVVMSLAFTSGFLNQRQHSDYAEEPEDLVKISKRERHDHAEEEAGEHEEQDEEGHQKDEEEIDGFYPEILTSFFGDGITIARRKPALERSASAPSAERQTRYFYPSLNASLSQKISSSTSLIPATNTTSVSSQTAHKVLRPAHTVPKPTSELKKPVDAVQNANGNVEGNDVDQRADAFIGDFYKKMKLQQVDPYMERLERSYGQ